MIYGPVISFGYCFQWRKGRWIAKPLKHIYAAKEFYRWDRTFG